MKIEIIASTKVGYRMSKEEAMDFSGKSAGICYLPDSVEKLFAEPQDKTQKRVNRNLESGHYSVFGHPTYNLILEGIPKIIAMILNNEKIYKISVYFVFIGRVMRQHNYLHNICKCMDKKESLI